MGRRTNEKFYNEYLALDSALAVKLGLRRGGVTEYINRLGANKAIPERDGTLKRLVYYRGLRNKMAHEADALRKLEGIRGEDVKWVVSFRKAVKRGRDPLAQYLRSEKRSARPALIALGLVALAALVALLIIILK